MRPASKTGACGSTPVAFVGAVQGRLAVPAPDAQFPVPDLVIPVTGIGIPCIIFTRFSLNPLKLRDKSGNSGAGDRRSAKNSLLKSLLAGNSDLETG
jgi:hypothetical protein